MIARILTLLPLLFLLGSGLLLFFINLAGASEGTVLNKFYWLEADTLGIDGASHSTTRWTMYNSCGVQDGLNVDCTSNKGAYPFSPADNFGESSSLPENFIDERDTYYYLSRFGYAFFLIAVVFNVFAILATLVSMFLPLSILLPWLAPLVVGLTFFFTLAASCFETAVFVKGRHNFGNAGYDASLGSILFGFAWTSCALLLLSVIVLPIISLIGSRVSKKQRNPLEDTEKEGHFSYSESN